ncbi:hypothetical protein HYW55_06065 [Candidatus Gottesmanbacteria bacterium]|nr:hypothetical protein [Candidatus Gottesmanbacteria bacterium]
MGYVPLFLFIFSLFAPGANAQAEDAPFVESETGATGRNQVTIQNEGSIPTKVGEDALSNVLAQFSNVILREEKIAAKLKSRMTKMEGEGALLGDALPKYEGIQNDLQAVRTDMEELSTDPQKDYGDYKLRLQGVFEKIATILEKERQLVKILRDISAGTIQKEGI